MTTYQCPALANYAALWLQFRDATLRAEIIAHRDTCPICTRLREATIERRNRNSNLHNEVSIIFPEQVTEQLANIMRRLYQIILIRPGDIGWAGYGARAESGRGAGGIRISSEAGVMAGTTTESEAIK